MMAVRLFLEQACRQLEAVRVSLQEAQRELQEACNHEEDRDNEHATFMD